MPTAAPGAGPQIGHVVIYRQNATTAYPAIITQVNANGTVGSVSVCPRLGFSNTARRDYLLQHGGVPFFPHVMAKEQPLLQHAAAPFRPHVAAKEQA